MKMVHVVAFTLLVIGGLNWLLIGLFDLNVVTYLGVAIAKIVYVLVGLSAVWLAVSHNKDCKGCSAPAAPSAPQI